MTISHDGEELTLPQAYKKLQSTDRSLREQMYRKIVKRRKQDQERLNELFSELIQLRHQIAQNADYDNYRDYKFDALERFDYEVKDCFDFHESVKETILPVVEQMMEKRKKRLGVERLRPWDLRVDPSGQPPLQPFEDTDQLIEDTIQCFQRIHPYFGNCLQQMKELGHFDLETRKNKAPGGYNYPLYETGAPFIFTNAAGTVNDLITMVHEGGHAVHTFLTNHLQLIDFKSLTAEIAELASMSMELFSLPYWDQFFEDEETLQRARFKEMERVLGVLPWIATIDKYQHWLYTHPEHSPEERKKAWRSISQKFTPSTIDWSELEEAFDLRWQGQLHLFEVPFYYIEYGIAQLGAIGMWRQYEQDASQALENYIKALRLGYTQPLPEIFKTAGLQFDFSKDYINELAGFVEQKLEEM
jgi:oligoendopeptidase F